MKYDYETLDMNGNAVGRGPPPLVALKEAGDHGWKLVWVAPNGIAYLMREIEEVRVKRAYTRRTLENTADGS